MMSKCFKIGLSVSESSLQLYLENYKTEIPSYLAGL